ncbi:hypothetical protein D3C80_1144260 [compost metagenome]
MNLPFPLFLSRAAPPLETTACAADTVSATAATAAGSAFGATGAESPSVEIIAITSPT